MLKKILDILAKYRNFIVYGIIGFTGAGLDMILFSLLINKTTIYYIFANCISVSVGITNNFLLNYYFNFKVKNNILKRYLSFYSVGILGLIVSTLLLYISVTLFSIDKLISKFIIILVVVVLQYSLNKKYSFR